MFTFITISIWNFIYQVIISTIIYESCLRFVHLLTSRQLVNTDPVQLPLSR